MQLILFIVFGVITLGAALAMVIRRDIFQSSLFLIISCLGVVGLFALLEAPIIAALQLLIYVGGIAVLIKVSPAPMKEMARSNAHGFNRRWWIAALVAAALCGTLGWAVLSHDWGADPGPVPTGSVAALGIVLIDPAQLALPLASAVVLFLAALVGAARIMREQ